jgi:hypothetical protein
MGTNTFYNEMQTVADDLLNEFGGTTKVTLKQKSSESFDVATQTNTYVETAGNETAWGIVNQYNVNEIDGTLIESNDLRLVLSAKDITSKPTTDNTVVWQGVSYRVMNVDNKSPGGVDIVYILQLRV